jgi:hypothetical protein
MAEAAYAVGPTLLRALRLLSSIFSEFFVPCFSAGPKPSAPVRVPKEGFLFPVSARDPNSAGPQRVQGSQKRSPRPPKV